MNRIEKEKRYIFIYTIGLIACMYLSFGLFNASENKIVGYFVPYAIYLTLLTIGILLFKGEKASIQPRKRKGNVIFYILTFVPVVSTFFIAFLPTIANVSRRILLMTLILSLLNGTLEELFWRRTFHCVFGDSISKAFIIPTILFTCWHFAFMFNKTITYTGGALTLVVSAALMGVTCGYTIYRTRNMKVTIVAHILVNVCAFLQMLAMNF